MTATFKQGLGRRSETILETLRNELDRGIYTPGQQIPREKDLCERFEASRSTVRRAISRLVAEGRLNVRKGSGMYVRQPREHAPGSKTISVMYPFDVENILDAQSQAITNGYLLYPFSPHRTHWDLEAECVFLDRVRDERHAALLAFCSPVPPTNKDALASLAEQGCRVIHLEHYGAELPRENYILPDYRQAGMTAATSLMLGGYDDLIIAELPSDGPYCQLLEQGFSQAMHTFRQGFEPQRDRLILDVGVEQRAYILREWAKRLDNRSAGILCRSTALANEILEFCKSAGLDVPGQVGILGVEILGYTRQPKQTDYLTFDRESLLSRAVEHAMNPCWSDVRELVWPDMKRHGTVRAAD